MPPQIASLPGFRRRPWHAPGSLAAWAALAAALVSAEQPPAASVYRRTGPTAGGDAATLDGAQAERIVASSLLALERADPCVAKIRQKVRIGNRVLTGSGRYVQAGVGEEQRFRFEAGLACVSESFDVVEVCDGLFSWGYLRHANDPPGLSRVDVRRVREKLEALEASAPRGAARYLGGLQRTLWRVREWFRFTAAEAVDLDGRPAWRVEGCWDVERLAMILPDLAEAARRPGGVEPGELPDGVPWRVVLWIDRGDQLPRRVEWLAIPGPRPAAAVAPEPIAVLDIYDVEVGGRVEPGAFFYKPAATGLMDVTEQTLKTLHAWRP